MRKKFIYLVLALFTLVLVGCVGGSGAESVTIAGPATGNVGEEINLTVTVLPADLKDKSVSWSTSDASIATVANGKVSLLKAGEVTITAKCGKKEGTHVITVSAAVATTGISVTGANSGRVGDQITLTATIAPANATNKTVVWSSTNTSVAEVENGVVTLKAAGEATIIATQGNLDGSIMITVSPVEVATERIEITGPTEANVGDELTLVATIYPENATNKEVTWGSMNPNIATVEDGVVTVLAGGTVEIFARQGNRIIDYHEITVTVETTGVRLEDVSDKNAGIGDIVILVAEVLPANASDKTVQWVSSDDNIATVVDGKVTFIGAGDVTITVSQGTLTDTITFTVYEELVYADSIIIDAESIDGIVGDEIRLVPRIQPVNSTFRDMTWSVSDASVATLADGVLTLNTTGKVTVRVEESKGAFGELIINSYEALDYIWVKFRDARRRTVTEQSIAHFGSTVIYIDLFPSVFPYRFNDPLVINREYMLPDDHDAHPNIKALVEWIVVHDTGNPNADAKGHATFMRNQSSVSWQYTVGNDGIYQSLEDENVSWHASSGSTRAGFTDTGIPAVNPGERPRMTLIDGYFAIKGIKTNVQAPGTAFVETGLWPVIMNGTYWIPNTTNRRQSEYSDPLIGLDGGNYDGIGIETSVYNGGDTWITWHKTAKLIAHLLKKHNLTTDRITFHNSFNNKACPQAALRSGNLPYWVEMMKFEYMVLTRFADYEFELTPINTNFLDNTGRVINKPVAGNFFDYKLKITAPNGTYREQSFRTSVV